MLNQNRCAQYFGFPMDWHELIPEQDWTSLPSGGAIGGDELGPCILQTGPEGGWAYWQSEDGFVRQEAEEAIEAVCKRARDEAQALLHANIPDNWINRNLNSCLPFRFGLDLPRAPSGVERKVLRINSFIVTGEPTKDYNCRGSALGCRIWLNQRLNERDEEFMDRVGCKPPPNDHDLPSDDIVLAFYKGNLGDGCHVARRLVDEWYESKCGAYLRIVHRRLDIESSFGTFLGRRLLDTKARDGALEQEAVVCKPIDDSLGFYGSRLQRMLDELDGKVPTPIPTS